MSGFVLQFGADTSGFSTGVKKVKKDLTDLSTGSISELKQQIKSLKGEISGLDASMLKSKGGQALASELRSANAELKKTEIQAGLTNQSTNNLTKGFSALRQIAYILPGLGIAGLIGAISAGIVGLAEAALGSGSAFSQAEISAGRFDETLKKIKESVDNLKSSLDLSGEIDKMMLDLKGLSGSSKSVGSRTIDIQNNLKFIVELDKNIKLLTQSNNNLVKFRTEAEKTIQAVSGEPTKLAKAIAAFGSLEIPDAIVKDLSESDQAIVAQYKKTNKALEELKKKRIEALSSNIKDIIGIPVDIFNKSQDLKKDIKPKPYKDPYKFEEIKMINSVFNYEAFKRFQMDNKNYRAAVQAELDKPFKTDLKLKLQPMGEGLEIFKKDLLEQLKVFEFYGNKIADVFTSAFDAIADGKNVFKAMGEAVKRLVVDMIKLAIRTFIVQKIMSFAAPTGALKGLSILGGGGLPGFASGGRPPMNRVSMVGENGPELFVPDTAGRIIPNNQLSGYAGAAMQMVSVTVNGVIDGRSLRLVTARQQAYENRNG